MKILFNPFISVETRRLSNKASQLNASYSASSTGSLRGLSAASRFVSQEKQIKSLLDLYAELVRNDVGKVDTMCSAVSSLDKRLMTVLASGSSSSSGSSGGGHSGGGGASGR